MEKYTTQELASKDEKEASKTILTKEAYAIIESLEALRQALIR